jgi:S-adenosylmethionine:tRNA ribosyltransferase-isomerase
VRTEDFSYELPPDRVAQTAVERGRSRMLVLDRSTGGVKHASIADLPGLLGADDVLLLNDTRVIPARLTASRSTGRRFEVLLLEAVTEDQWQALVRPSARVRAGDRLLLADGGAVLAEAMTGRGQWLIRCDPPLDLDRLERLGAPPLPPYIRRPHGPLPEDRERYQTVYARQPGAVAAPTAGLHLSDELLDRVRARGCEMTAVTLHVGPGTFRPVETDDPREHSMHSERYHISDQAAEQLSAALTEGRRIVCVGTTTVRTLESALLDRDRVVAGSGTTDLFIAPGFSFRGTGALLTNFHLPRSTLLMLVSALAGRKRVLAAYEEAVEAGYRFYSYGDAMLIL